MLNKLKQAFLRFSQNPLQFLFRQVYKIFVVLPTFLVLEVFFFVRYILHNTSNKPVIKECVIITSVIYPKEKKTVSFGAVRSVYLPEDRARQTVESIMSVREFLPEAKIILVEGGLKDMKEVFFPLVDQYEYMGKNFFVRLACDGKSKSLGEATMLIRLASRLAWRSDYYWKLSGRYILNNNFVKTDWVCGGFSFLRAQKDWFSTRLYGFSEDVFFLWEKALCRGWFYHILDYPVENTMSKFVPAKRLFCMKVLGVQGLGGSSKDIITE